MFGVRRLESQSVPDASQVRSKAAEILARDDYDLEVRRVDSTWLNELVLEVLSWLIAPFRWIYELTEGWPDIFRWGIILALVAVICFLLWHIIGSIAKALRDPLGGGAKLPVAGRAVVEPEEFERKAESARIAADYITAVRLLFRAGVLQLERRESRPLKRGLTNRALLRRYKDQPVLSGALQTFVEVVDAKWYGEGACEEADYSLCRAAYEDLRHAPKGSKPHVYGA
ncbi:MAG: hypothetical protein C0483_17345 [Pirellula sp.]|nr:hypothetical protein [Pirellula sp.]